eukprot:gene12580-biopygen11184
MAGGRGVRKGEVATTPFFKRRPQPVSCNSSPSKAQPQPVSCNRSSSKAQKARASRPRPAAGRGRQHGAGGDVGRTQSAERGYRKKVLRLHSRGYRRLGIQEEGATLTGGREGGPQHLEGAAPVTHQAASRQTAAVVNGGRMVGERLANGEWWADGGWMVGDGGRMAAMGEGEQPAGMAFPSRRAVSLLMRGMERGSWAMLIQDESGNVSLDRIAPFQNLD